MSTPPFLNLPVGTTASRVETVRGEFAVLDTLPHPDAPPQPTAVLVPGFTGSKEDFIAVLEPLAAAGHRVVALDQRGQYETPGPDDPAAYEVEALACDLLAVISAVADQPVHLVGHSFGGIVARATLLAEPQAVRSLTLLSSGPAAVTGPPADRLALLGHVLQAHGLGGLWQALRALDEAEGRVVDPPPDVAAFLHRRFHANAAAGLLRMAEAPLSEPDRVDELGRLTTPVLVAHGSDDDVWLPDVQEGMARRLGAAYAELAGATHSPAAEVPDVTARTLTAFWASGDVAGVSGGDGRDADA